MGGDSDGGSGDGATEARALGSHQDNLARALVLMEKQRHWLRGIACFVALVVVVAAGYLEWEILKYILDPNSQTGNLFFVLAVSPIASITLIVIFVLIGVFRGFRDKDMTNIPAETAMKVVSGD